MSESKPKPCPFCGGTKLKIDSKVGGDGWTGITSQVKITTYSVQCNVCHARGGTASGRVIQSNILAYIDCMPEWATTEDALKEAAIKAWNNRADNVAPVVHAEWIDCRNGNATCSNCRIRSKAVYDYDNEQHYCGHCGAKMDGRKTYTLAEVEKELGLEAEHENETD